MSLGGSRGVNALASLMQQLANGEPVRANEFAEANGFARSSVFDLARRMQDAGFLVRDASGALLSGPHAFEFAWSKHGLAGLHGPAEAVVVWLRDQIDGDISLMAGADELLAIRRSSRKDSGEGTQRHAAIHDPQGVERLTLSLRLSEQTDASAAETALAQAVATLERCLESLH